jgi:hypothetical protein
MLNILLEINSHFDFSSIMFMIYIKKKVCVLNTHEHKLSPGFVGAEMRCIQYINVCIMCTTRTLRQYLDKKFCQYGK